MNHDDLCPQAYPYGRDEDLDSFFGKKDWDCRCELITKVREDERKEAQALINSIINAFNWRTSLKSDGL